jgi:hypothetical protein
MVIKMFEVRDRATCIPVMAIKMYSADCNEIFLLRRAGYGFEQPLIMLVELCHNSSSYDPYSWGDTRTIRNAHMYIQENFDSMDTGDVVDVEFILGEVDTPKISERRFYC